MLMSGELWDSCHAATDRHAWRDPRETRKPCPRLAWKLHLHGAAFAQSYADGLSQINHVASSSKNSFFLNVLLFLLYIKERKQRLSPLKVALEVRVGPLPSESPVPR